MRKIYCTFSGAQYDETTQRIVEDAPNFGVDEVRIYDDKWLMGTEFYRLNKWIFELKSRNEQRGFGWYCFKAYVLLLEMERQWRSEMVDEDNPPIILWTDADTYPIGDLTPLYDQCRKDGGIMLFAAEGCVQGAWTKRDCMIAMGEDIPVKESSKDAARPARINRYQKKEDPSLLTPFEMVGGFRHASHAVGRFALFEAGNWKAKQFLMEWLTYCLNPLCVGLEPSLLAPEYTEYNEHRSDQSILANLAHKYGLKLYREADGFGDGSERDREIFGTVFKQVGQYDKAKSLKGSRFRNV